MIKQIKGPIIYNSSVQFVDIYAYSSHGLPGIEINLPKNWGKVFKEKLIFLTKKRMLRIPLKRYVISYDIPALHSLSQFSQVKWLELPTFICFWSLAGFLSINQLEYCVACGYMNINNEIMHLKLEGDYYEDFSHFIREQKKEMTYITSQSLFHDIHEPVRFLNANDLL